MKKANMFFDNYEIKMATFGHLGLISTYFEELGLLGFFDKLMPKPSTHKITCGEAILAFILNGLSLERRELYLSPKFFQGLALARLFGRNIEADDLNEALMAELLDKICQFGPTKLFQLTMLHILNREKIDLTRFHPDATNFSVWGDSYTDEPEFMEQPDPANPAIQINVGRPADGRWYLNRFTLGLISNTQGIPLFMKTFSENDSDQQTLKEAMVQFQSGLRQSLANDGKAAHFIADAAFYSKTNIANFGSYWISRVPATLTESEDLLHQDVALTPVDNDKRYSFYETSSNYGEVGQKWVLIYSQEMGEKNEMTFASRLEKQLSKAQAALNRLKNKRFACEAEARAESTKWIRAYELLEFRKFRIVHGNYLVDGPKECPKKRETVQEPCFIEAELGLNTEAVARERRGLGRFILASNDESLSGQQILKIYKEQSQVERGFRFMKGRIFLVSEAFLQKKERIEALAFIMVMCLTFYSLLEAKMRKGLARQGLPILKNLKKSASKPTLKWAFERFTMVGEAKIMLHGAILKIDLTRIEPDNFMPAILEALGPNFKKTYGFDGS